MKPYDLTTPDNVKAIAKLKSTDSSLDTRLPFLISAFSKTIGRYSRRQLIGRNEPVGEPPTPPVDVDAVEWKTYEYDGSGYLSLAPYEIREIVAVKIDGQTIDVDTEVAGSPRQKTPEGTYLSLDLPTWGGVVDVEISGKWGIVEVPEDVELACIHAVAEAVGNPQGVARRTVDGIVFEDDDSPGAALPSDSRKLLTDFVRA